MSSNVNLLVVSDLASNSGGSYRVAIESCLALAGCGVRPQLIHAGDEIDESLQAERNVILHRLDLPDVTAMGGLRGAFSYVWSADSYRKCLRLFRQVSQTGPTLVHVHSYGRRFSPAVFSAAKRVGIPIVLSLHDYFAFSPTGLHYDFGNDCTLSSDANVWTPWRTTDRKTSHHWLRGARLAFCRRSGIVPSAIDLFIAVSERSRKFAANFLPERSLRTIYSPVSAMGGRCRPSENRELVFLGRFSREKGIAQLARGSGGRLLSRTFRW